MRSPHGPATVMGTARPIATGGAGKADALRAARRECAARRLGSPQSGNLPEAMDPTPRATGAPGGPSTRSGAPRHVQRRGPSIEARRTPRSSADGSLADSGGLTAASIPRVRDSAASLPDSGAVAAGPSPCPTPCRARRTQCTPVVTLPTVHVDATLARARRRAPTAFVTALARRCDRVRSPRSTDALVEAAGVRVTQYGGMGAFSTMSLRGAPPGHVTVLLDGVPLTSAAHGRGGPGGTSRRPRSRRSRSIAARRRSRSARPRRAAR